MKVKRSGRYRWMAVGGVLFGVGFWVWQPEAEPVSPPGLPSLAAPSMLSFGAMQASGPSGPVASTGAPTTQGKPPGIDGATQKPWPGVEIGSEGYGPHVQAALGGSPADAFAAANQIARCAGIRAEVEAVYRLGHSQEMAKRGNAGYVATVSYIEEQQRRCQTITDDIARLSLQLLAKAAEGGEQGAAFAYLFQAEKAGAGVDAETRQKMNRALRRDADAGDLPSITALAYPSEKYGLSEVEFRTYGLAYRTIVAGQQTGVWTTAHQATLSVLDLLYGDTTLTSSQQATVKSGADKIVAAFHLRSAKGS